jgi:hypothetical protein
MAVMPFPLASDLTSKGMGNLIELKPHRQPRVKIGSGEFISYRYKFVTSLTFARKRFPWLVSDLRYDYFEFFCDPNNALDCILIGAAPMFGGGMHQFFSCKETHGRSAFSMQSEGEKYTRFLQEPAASNLLTELGSTSRKSE